MRAKTVRPDIGDRKKHLLSGDIYKIMATGNLNGGGDLFIKNENTGKEEKCYTRDWEDPRKYSNTILEFQQGGNPYEKMGLGLSAKIKAWFDEWAPDVDYEMNGKDIIVKGYLDLNRTNITHLPDDLIVGGSLNLGGNPITHLPDNLTVKGNLWLINTSITNLTKDLKVKGNIYKDF